MKKVDYSIEYAHIYLNETFSDEHRRSIDELKHVVAEVVARDASYSLTIIVDDYNATEQILDLTDLHHQLRELDAEPDYMGSEAALEPYTEQMLVLIEKDSVRREYQRYIEKNKKVPCSFMIAVWYLLRFGVLDPALSPAVIKRVSPRSVSFAAENIITILPGRYAGVEERAHRLLKATRFAGLTDRITNLYYDTNVAVSHADLY